MRKSPLLFRIKFVDVTRADYTLQFKCFNDTRTGLTTLMDLRSGGFLSEKH